MIAEQDFILHIRRMHRLNIPGTVVNIVRNLTDYSKTAAENPDGDKLKALSGNLPGDMHIMSNGDAFIVLPKLSPPEVEKLRSLLADVVAPAGTPEEREKAAVSYTLPGDYTALREQANTYVELARAVEVMGPVRQAEEALQAGDVRGPLTAWSLSQVEQLLNAIDIKRYVHTQPVYQQMARGVWERRYIDFYVSIADLQRERFPRLVLDTPARLFLELCCTLDRKLFQELSYQADNWKDRQISINMAAETVLSSVFAQFCHVLPKERRPNVAFDIHRSDLFLNFSTTMNAITVLKEEGFRVGIDGISPNALPYVHFERFDVDYYKINVGRDKLEDFKKKPVIEAMALLNREKIIFNHCDSEEALRLGQSLGVSMYQGWLIDDVANAIVH
jgi:EAL domain-containing protein (putative c-di-GMP-specific phosphodiesterase class I)